MNNSSLSDLSPVYFLQTFIVELMHASEQLGHQHCQELIEHIARTAGRFFEDIYRLEYAKQTEALDKENYIDLILGLKNNIGGKFSLLSSNEDSIVVSNSCCPFGDKVVEFPSLCGMTSSVFGGIASRNFGYAKVEIAKSIAQQDGCCEVYIHFNEQQAESRPGIEYRDASCKDRKQQDFDELHNRIEASLLKIWQHQGKKPVKKNLPPVIIANSEKMKKVLQAIEVVAPSPVTVHIQGKTGVGKELVARAIHAMSDRSQKPFVPINCGAIPETLLESVLFGHEKGAFTGALEVHQGFFERADGGTLFLDEVDSLSPAAQTRLLRVLQEGELERVGGKQIISVDVRIVSASNSNLKQQVEEGRFRHDLYYRINVAEINIPTLKERPDDLPALVNLILQRMSKKHQRKIESVSRDVMQKIRAYHWPGNVRELENVLERSLLFTQGTEISELKLEFTENKTEVLSWKQQKQQVIDDMEKSFLQSSLKQYQGNIKQIAEIMEISTRAVYAKLKKYQINPERYR